MIKRKNRKSNFKRKSNIEGVLLSISPLVGYLLFGFVPMLIAIIMSFHHVQGYSLTGIEFAGFHNYLTVFKDDQFWLSLRNTLIMGLSMPISLVLSLIMAYFISKKLKGSNVFRAIYFIPFVSSVVAVTYMWQWLFNTNYGVINQMLGMTGDNAIDWLGTERNFIISVIIMNVWSGTGYGIVLYSASLTNIQKNLLEQADIDGANAFQKFFHITLPSISPTTFYLFTMGLIGVMQAFAVQNILANNTTGPDDAGLTAVFYIYRNIFSYVNTMGIAAAASWLLAILIAILTSINFYVSRFWVNYD
jgi:multiple sugar transport system permease protein